MTKEISAKEVELYLLKNTDFFLTRESIVSELNFKHSPGKAESLLERQVRKLRSEQKDLLAVSYTHLTLPTTTPV